MCTLVIPTLSAAKGRDRCGGAARRCLLSCRPPTRFLPFAVLRVGMTAPVIVRSLCMLLMIAFLAATATAAPPDLTKEPTLYVVGYAHLDTQWRWEYPRTIGEFLL